MDVSSLALFSVEQIQNFAIGIGTNLASEVLVRMTQEKKRSVPDSFEPELRREMANCVVSCLQEEPDEKNRQLLARCLFDDASIHDIVSLFLSRDYDPAKIIAGAEARLPTGLAWEDVKPAIEGGVARLVERFKQAISSDQVLFNRLAMAGWQRDEQQAADIREMKHVLNGIMQVQRTVADFPKEGTPDAVGRPAISNTSGVLSSAGEFPTQSNAAVAFLKDDFESALEELRFGSAKKARVGFELVVGRLEKVGVDVDRTLYYRAKCNLGLSAYAAGGAKEFAAQCLEQAFPFADGSVKGRINLALARSLQNRELDAVTILSAILLEDELNFEARVNRGDSLLRLERRDDALADFQQAKAQNRQQQMTLASAFLAANAFDDATREANTLLRDHPEDSWGKMILSTAIGLPIVEKVNDQKLATGFRPREDTDAIRIAKSLLEDILPWARNCDRPDKLLEVLSNLAAFCSVLGDHRTALNYADEAAAQPDCGESVHRNRFLAAVLTGSYEKALESAQALEEWMPIEEAVVRQVEALKGMRRYQEGLALIEKVKGIAGGTIVSAYLRVLEVDLTLDLPDIEKAEQLTVELNRDFPQDAIAWLSTAELARQRNDPAQEIYLKNAVDCADVAGLRLQCRGLLGQYYGRTARWKEALDLLLPTEPDQDYETPYKVEIAVCYFNLGRHSEALKMAESRLQDGYEFEACDLAIQSCLAMVELEKARQLAELMRREDGRNQVAAWCYLAHLEFRLNRAEEARKILVAAIAKKADTKLLLLQSNICLHLGRHDEALRSAVQALEVAEDEAKTRCHLAIVHASLCLPETSKIERPLRRQIKKSYATLARQEGSGFSMVPVDPDFAALKKMLQAQQKAASEGQRLFSEQGLPIYVLTYMAGRDIESVWRGLVGGNGLRVNMANGFEEDQRKQHELAFKCSGVVLDATALLTFCHLNLLKKLPEIFDRVVVTFPLYEKFLGLLNDAKHGPESAGWIALVDNNLHLQEFEKGARERAKQDIIEPIVAFMEKIERVGFQEPQEVNEAGSFLKHCDPVVWASVLASQQLGLPLLCDDVGTLQVARMACKVEGFCTQTALRLGEIKKVITDSEYADAVVRLFESNYYFVAEDVHSMINYLGRHGWQLSPSVKALLERFDSGAVTRVPACRIMGGILAHAWLRAATTEERDRWLSYICERLRSIGDPVENFHTAFLGAIEVYVDTPDLFSGMVHAICRVPWLPAELLNPIKQGARLFMRGMGNERLAHLGQVRQRWVTLSRSMK
jgi:tetratricopeptide (TPR) repeat protein